MKTKRNCWKETLKVNSNILIIKEMVNKSYCKRLQLQQLNVKTHLFLLILVFSVCLNIHAQDKKEELKHLPVAELYFDDILATKYQQLDFEEMPGEIDQVMFSDNGEVLVVLVNGFALSQFDIVDDDSSIDSDGGLASDQYLRFISTNDWAIIGTYKVSKGFNDDANLRTSYFSDDMEYFFLDETNITYVYDAGYHGISKLGGIAGNPNFPDKNPDVLIKKTEVGKKLYFKIHIPSGNIEKIICKKKQYSSLKCCTNDILPNYQLDVFMHPNEYFFSPSGKLYLEFNKTLYEWKYYKFEILNKITVYEEVE